MLLYTCQPAISQQVYTLDASRTCDDGLACTHTDTCATGLCKGTLYTSCLMFEFTRNPALDCQQCDGVGGCSVATGYLGSVVTIAGRGRVCGCKINGADYAHGTINPDNQCQECDVLRNTTHWVHRADGILCDDGNSCSYTDVCTAGQCVGVAYSCVAQECHSQYECDGNGGCTSQIYSWADRRACGPTPTNECDLQLTCDGQRAVCPPYSGIQPRVSSIISTDQVDVLYGRIPGYDGLYRKPLRHGAVSLAAGEALELELTGFDVVCDELTVRWGYAAVTTDAEESTCSWSHVEAHGSPGLQRKPFVLATAVGRSRYSMRVTSRPGRSTTRHTKTPSQRASRSYGTPKHG